MCKFSKQSEIEKWKCGDRKEQRKRAIPDNNQRANIHGNQCIRLLVFIYTIMSRKMDKRGSKIIHYATNQHDFISLFIFETRAANEVN